MARRRLEGAPPVGRDATVAVSRVRDGMWIVDPETGEWANVKQSGRMNVCTGFGGQPKWALSLRTLGAREMSMDTAIQIRVGEGEQMPVNPVLLSPTGLTRVVSDWYPEEADGEVVNDLRGLGVRLVSLDIETTHLDESVGQVTEISWYNMNTGEGGTFIPAHDLVGADPVALEISKYHERIAGQPQDDGTQFAVLQDLLGGDGVKTHLVGSNPDFDARHLTAMATRTGLPTPRFHHRKIDVAQPAYWLNPGAPFATPTGLKEATGLAGLALDHHHEAWVNTVAAARLWHVWENVRRNLPSR